MKILAHFTAYIYIHDKYFCANFVWIYISWGYIISFSALPSLPAPVELPYHVAPAGNQPEVDWIFETLRSLGLKQELGLIKREKRAMRVNRENDFSRRRAIITVLKLQLDEINEINDLSGIYRGRAVLDFLTHPVITCHVLLWNQHLSFIFLRYKPTFLHMRYVDISFSYLVG